MRAQLGRSNHSFVPAVTASLVTGGLVVLGLFAAGCWGSASESPWPAEPADVDLGPAGEEELRNPGRNSAKPTATPESTQPATKSSARPKSEPGKVEPRSP
ncbi:MAG: hypothetical protein HOW73_34950 [Polyangiaceae bacterium]|nr:hypothetical protein [Polyangiaceae bacterium]